VGAFMYDGDAPLAERRAQALALDSSLLAELLGQADARELLDPDIVGETERDAQCLSAHRRCRGLEAVADMLTALGPLSAMEVEERCAEPGSAPEWLDELAAQRRLIEVRVAGQERWVAVEDAGRLRDGLGVALPPGVPDAFTEPVPDPLGDLVARYARTHGPFTAATVAQRFGLGTAVTTDALRRLAADGRVAEGEFLPGGRGTEWCETGMLRLLRRRCLAKLRREAEPVPPQVFARFLPTWQNAGRAAGPGRGHGAGTRPARPGRPARPDRPATPDAVYDVIEQLAGVPIPASALETLVLPGRVPGYSPALLDELTAAGEIVWSGAGGLPGGDGWLVIAPADAAPLLFGEPAEITMTPVHDAVLAALDGGGALFFRALGDRVAAELRGGGASAAALGLTDQTLAAAIWDLVWAGRLTNDTLAPLRTVLGAGRPVADAGPGPSAAMASSGDGASLLDAVGLPGGARSARSGRYGQDGRGGRAARPGLPGGPGSVVGLRRPRLSRAALPSRSGPPTVSGRWSLLPQAEEDRTRRLHALAGTLLDRHGVLIRGAVAAERVTGGFGAIYPVLRAMEEAGQCRRGYFVEGLGAAQFALPGAVDRMRAMADANDGSIVVLAAADPANAYGSALPWPARPDETPGGHRPGRKAGALVVLADGQLVLYVERGGKTLLSWTSDPALLDPAAAALADAVREGALGRLTVERADGGGVYDSPLARALEQAGFRPTPRGLRLRAQ
jgi:ATP-dependent helicase Lhr and Lhr-like helicase